VQEAAGDSPEAEAAAVRVEGGIVDLINDDLSAGANVSDAKALKSNETICSPGVKLHGAGFIVNSDLWVSWGRPLVVHPYRNGRDLTDAPRGVMVIDLFGLTETQAREGFPAVYQHVREHVKPERDQNNRSAYRDNWWIFGEARSSFRPALAGLHRYIAVPHIAKYRAYQFLEGKVVPDNMVIAFASDDAWILGILQSSVHEAWVLAAGGTLENRPIYYKTRCFDPFPFPDVDKAQKEAIRGIAERLDAHRKAAQGRGVTLTQMYNLLAKLRAGETFTPKDQVQHQAAQTEILRQFHDELDQAVFEAYGWPSGMEDAEILERLVALNRERASEEARGLVRWLRPEYQCPESIQPIARPLVEEEAEPEVVQVAPIPAIPAQPWPKDLKEQLAALRGLLLSSDHLWTMEEVGAAFKSRGRYRDSIQAHLGLLTDLGVVVALESADGLRFHRPQAKGA
jgi:hypothetical protein